MYSELSRRQGVSVSRPRPEVNLCQDYVKTAEKCSQTSSGYVQGNLAKEMLPNFARVHDVFRVWFLR
jgi:hypothetical protein